MMVPSESPSYRADVKSFPVAACQALAGLSDGAARRWWFRIQVLMWLCLCIISFKSAIRWVGLLNPAKLHLAVVIGTIQAVGHVLVDLTALLGLLLADISQRRQQRRLEDKDASFQRQVSPEKDLCVDTHCRWLTALGVLLAVMEAAFWLPKLQATLRRQTGKFLATALTGICVVLTRPGLMCALQPAVFARHDAGAILADLLADIDAADRKTAWDQIVIKFAQAEKQVKTICGEHSSCLLLSMALCAALRGVSVWVWYDKTHLVSTWSVVLNGGLAAMYSLCFVVSYFMFTGISALHWRIVSSVAGKLEDGKGDEVWRILQFYHYLQTRRISWNMQLLPGLFVSVDDIKGRYFSATMFGNLAAKCVVPSYKRGSSGISELKKGSSLLDLLGMGGRRGAGERAASAATAARSSRDSHRGAAFAFWGPEVAALWPPVRPPGHHGQSPGCCLSLSPSSNGSPNAVAALATAALMLFRVVRHPRVEAA
eukprot:TRINITY_DN51144_c0_g1_i1.p1 TRINITY_DN51144_c0_g1~~TRINITY_DN51144_c0_g1_i1.p1  ORF type:complete len:485 (+),score=97.48 TRINITY_DN51144_c0_g1_i1:70-1524(+)